MPHSNEHGLSDFQLGIIIDILQPYANKIQSVGLFGSRATGRFRPNSDIDMVIYCTLTEREVNSIWTEFEECYLPISVDIYAYDLIENSAFKSHIDAVVQTLFTQQDLQSAARKGASL